MPENDFFKWDKTFETNIVRIDLQHRILIKILNELYDIIIEEKEKEVSAIIYELIQYSKYHFSTEEELFDKYNYIEKKEHKKEHQKFVDKIQEFASKMNTDKGTLAIKLMDFLKDWLTEHILDIDQRYAIAFKKQGVI